MSTIVCGRGAFNRLAVCKKAKRKTWFTIAAIYLSAGFVAAIGFSSSRSAQAASQTSSQSVSSRAH